jgi:hypothetical protein
MKQDILDQLEDDNLQPRMCLTKRRQAGLDPSALQSSHNVAQQDSPGQRPGFSRQQTSSPERALQGTLAHNAFVSPFQGLTRFMSSPSALPWAVLFRPFRAFVSHL